LADNLKPPDSRGEVHEKAMVRVEPVELVEHGQRIGSNDMASACYRRLPWSCAAVIAVVAAAAKSKRSTIHDGQFVDNQQDLGW